MGEATAVTGPAPGPPTLLHPDPQASAPPAVSEPTAGPVGPACSPAMKTYFETLHAEAMRCYAIAKQARRKGKDPTLEVEIPPAEDLAARVEAQVGPPGVAQQIRDATTRLGNREVVSLQVAQDVADEMSRTGAAREKALDQAVRTGLSILTEGVLVAPLEGIAEVKIGSNSDGSDYVDLYFAGPIRAAGGTAQAMSVLIADLVRRRLGIGAFHVTEGEVERYKEEIAAYKVEAHLQYNPSPAEIEAIARNCPVCINGEGTEQEEVTGNRDLPRVETNQLRGGACLVMAEGMILKAPKVMKHVEKLKLQGWDFLAEFAKKADKKGDEAQVGSDGLPEIPPSKKFILEIIAGRPVFSHPSRAGGFRLRYGRARTAGLASNAFHPATMAILDDFLAVGTQLKVERPGKGTVATPCDTIEGPTVLLHNGSLVRVRSIDEARELRPAVKEIVDIGEILIPYGEFTENNAALPRSSWVWEWWVQEHQKATGEAGDVHPTGSLSGADMVRLAEATGIPLHPDGTLLWHDVTAVEMRDLGTWALRNGYFEAGTLWLPDEAGPKETLVKLLALHRAELAADGKPARLAIDERLAVPLLRGLGLDLGETDAEGGQPVADTERRRILFDPCQPDLPARYATVELASRLSGFKLMPRAPFRIGGRMGRPEKADARKMAPPPHGLFPLGGAGGLQRLVRDAAAGSIQVEVGVRRCASCGRKGWRTFCDCGGHTDALTAPARQKGQAFQEREATTIDLKAELDRARTALQLDRLPETIKGVQGVINADKVPEPLEKALLRARHGIYVFKDGTVRFDMTDVPLTHFRPKEVGAPVAKLVELGYTHDNEGKPLERDDQLLELRVQDIVVADACGDYLLKTTKYLDDLLVRFYGLKPYYNLEKRKDLIGHLAIGLAPHTSGGVLCRIIGFTKAQCHFGHPYFHAAKRRNCLDGNTGVFVLNSPAPTRRTLRELFDVADAPLTSMDEAGTVARPLEGVRVLAADPHTGRMESKQAIRILRVPSPAHLLRIRTRQGRDFTCSPGHRVEVIEGGRIVKRKASAIRLGDPLPAVARLVVEEHVPKLDLISLWQARPDLVVRGLGMTLSTAIAEAGGRNEAARRMGLTPRALDNHVRRDSVPWKNLRRLLPAAKIPDASRLGRLRDRISVPARMEMTPELMRLAGYYTAEGCARSAAVHQIDIAASESDIVADVVRCASSVFGSAPRPQPTRVTLSGRLVHDLFIEILGLGRNAHEKRIPTVLSAAPKPLMAAFLAAYFAGDGSVEAGRAHVTCHSVSRGLLQDIALQLTRFGIASRFSTATRPAGGAVAAFYRKKGRPPRSFTVHRLSIRSTHAAAFAGEIGFASKRKQESLLATLHKIRSSRMQSMGDLVLDQVVSSEHVESSEPFLYDLEVEGHHNFATDDLLITSNCDGDEDAVLLLLDGLVNFSRKYVPDKRGGLMDLPLVLSTRLDPNEVDKETHNVDTLRRYPLSFYEATTRHIQAKDIAKTMGLVEKRIGTPAQYEGFGFTHDTADINAGPAASSYKTLGSMLDKMTAQMELARKIRAVDEADVGARVIGTHFLPDLMGNLKAFSRQKVRCPKCNEKFRRMPLKGVCLACGNENLTLTVHEGSVRKYLEVSKTIATKYKIDAYTHQRILLLEAAVESLFTNDKVKKSKLSDFF